MPLDVLKKVKMSKPILYAPVPLPKPSSVGLRIFLPKRKERKQ